MSVCVCFEIHKCLAESVGTNNHQLRIRRFERGLRTCRFRSEQHKSKHAQNDVIYELTARLRPADLSHQEVAQPEHCQINEDLGHKVHILRD